MVLSDSHPQLLPYEQVRLQQCMQNNARLAQLGIPPLVNIFGSKDTNRQKRKKPNHREREESGSEYDPEQDDACESDNAQVLIHPS